MQGTRKNEFIWKFVFSFHVHRIALGLSPLRISSKTLSIEPNLFLDWSSPLISAGWLDMFVSNNVNARVHGELMLAGHLAS